MGYGEELGEAVINECTLSAETRGGYVVYRNTCGGVEKILAGKPRLVVLPIYPVLYPKMFTTYILVMLSTPVHLGPEEEVALYIDTPVDVAVYAFQERGGPERDTAMDVLAMPLKALSSMAGREEFTIIDVVAPGRVKYTLYGMPETGVLARHHVSSPGPEPPPARLGTAYIRVVFRNRTREWVTVTRILLDARKLRLWYRRGTWEAFYSRAVMTVTSRSTASVDYVSERPSGDAVAVPDPEELRPGRLPVATDMLWGV